MEDSRSLVLLSTRNLSFQMWVYQGLTDFIESKSLEFFGDAWNTHMFKRLFSCMICGLLVCSFVWHSFTYPVVSYFTSRWRIMQIFCLSKSQTNLHFSWYLLNEKVTYEKFQLPLWKSVSLLQTFLEHSKYCVKLIFSCSEGAEVSLDGKSWWMPLWLFWHVHQGFWTTKRSRHEYMWVSQIRNGLLKIGDRIMFLQSEKWLWTR